MEIYFKDSFYPAGTKLLDTDDRSFRFGDGIFETAVVANGKVYDWPNHQKRMEEGLKYFKLDVDVSNVVGIIAELIKRNQVNEGYIRVTISRGDSAGVVGYKVGSAKPYMIITTIAKPLPLLSPAKLFLSSQKLFYNYPCKTNNALVYTMAFMEAEENGCNNALLLSHENYICETANANIFWLKNNIIYTPATGLPFIPGTFRKRIFELWDGKIEEGKFTLDDLKEAEEIFLTNVGGIITPVTEVKPLGIKLAKQAAALGLREKLVKEIRHL